MSKTTPSVIYHLPTLPEAWPKHIPDEIMHNTPARKAWLDSFDTPMLRPARPRSAKLYHGHTIREWAEELGLSLSYVHKLRRSSRLDTLLSQKGYLP